MLREGIQGGVENLLGFLMGSTPNSGLTFTCWLALMLAALFRSV